MKLQTYESWGLLSHRPPAVYFSWRPAAEDLVQLLVDLSCSSRVGCCRRRRDEVSRRCKTETWWQRRLSSQTSDLSIGRTPPSTDAHTDNTAQQSTHLDYASLYESNVQPNVHTEKELCRWCTDSIGMRVDLSPRLGGTHSGQSTPPTTVLLSFTFILPPAGTV